MRLPSPVSKLLLRVAPWLLPVAAFASMVELIGGGWDIQWHIAHVPEFFWTPPHIVLYSGAGLVLLSTAGALPLPWARRSVAGALFAPAPRARPRALLPSAAG